VLAYLDEHVRGKTPSRAPAPVRIFVMGANQWRDEQAWPPESAGTHEFHLASGGHANSRYGDGRLLTEPVRDEQPPDEWTHDPDRPVPFITGEGSGQIGGPDDYLGVESRGDVLVYSTEPLTKPVELIGPVTLVAHVATSAADTDVMAKLIDVHPGGFAQRLCDGMVRLRYRNGFHQVETVAPGEVYEVRIALWDTCVRIEAGHQIRVEVASSALPKYDVNLGTGGDMITETEGVTATNRIWHTPSRPSRLIVGGPAFRPPVTPPV
jgi:putative CocE/NonD family hydrolase